MLIVGDLAINYLKESNEDIDSLDIVCYTSQIIYLENFFNVKDKGIRLGNEIRKYELTKKISLYLYLADGHPILRKMLELTFSESQDKFRFAGPQLLYMFNHQYSRFRHLDIQKWEKTVQDYNYILKRHILPEKQSENEIINELNFLSLGLRRTISFNDILNKNDNKNLGNYLTYHEKDLLNIYASSERETWFNATSDSTYHKIDKDWWEHYSFDNKINSILERSYAMAINDYYIPCWNKFKRKPYDVLGKVKRSIMNLVTSRTTEDWLKTFIINHYNIIINKINNEYYLIFENAKKYGDLEEIKEAT